MAQSPTMQVPGGTTERNAASLGFWAAILLAALAATAFALGITTPPRSGPYCLGNCVAYPYTDAVQFVPRDYLWVAPALLPFPVFLVLAGCIHPCVSVAKRHLIVIGLCFASIAATIISLDYFVQFQVLEPSLVKGETSTLSLFTQYNPHGFFIALEDLGYLMLSAAFLFIGAAFPGINRLGRAIRWVFLVPAVLAFASFFGMSWHFGFNIEYRFEVAVITIIWTALLVLGVMLAVFFRRGGSELTVK